MAFFQAVQCKYPGPIPALMNSDGANDVVAIVGDFTTVTGMVSGDIVEMVGLPANYVPVDLVIASEALAATITLDVGVLSGNFGALLDIAGSARTCGTEALAAQSFATAGVFRPNKPQFGLLAPTAGDPTTTPVATTGDRGIGLKITGTLTTLTVGAKVRFTLLARPKVEGV